MISRVDVVKGFVLGVTTVRCSDELAIASAEPLDLDGFEPSDGMCVVVGRARGSLVFQYERVVGAPRDACVVTVDGESFGFVCRDVEEEFIVRDAVVIATNYEVIGSYNAVEIVTTSLAIYDKVMLMRMNAALYLDGEIRCLESCAEAIDAARKMLSSDSESVEEPRIALVAADQSKIEIVLAVAVDESGAVHAMHYSSGKTRIYGDRDRLAKMVAYLARRVK